MNHRTIRKTNRYNFLLHSAAMTAAFVFLSSCQVSQESLQKDGSPTEVKREWRSLFNGKDLTGWDGDPKFWSVKDGVIHGETTLKNLAKNNTFLIWRGGRVRDFELQLKFRIESGNSGVQFRSIDRGDWSVAGYQAEVCNEMPQVGFLYEESTRRGSLAKVGEFVMIDKSGQKHVISKIADPNDLIKAGYYKPKEWNEYTIIARGNYIVQKLNGHQTVELVDLDTVGRERQGILALQLHIGPPMVVEFKDIRLKQFEMPFENARSLFNGKDLTGLRCSPGSWVVKPDGVLLAKGRGNIWTDEQFGDFILDLEFKVEKNGNSGVFFRTADINDRETAIEMQVLDSYMKTGPYETNRHVCGAIYDCQAPWRNVVNKPGEWNRATITAIDNWISVTLNNVQIIDMDLNRWTEPHKNPDGTPNKFRTAYRDMPRKGYIGLQYHNDPVWYRNIRIVPLPSAVK